MAKNSRRIFLLIIIFTAALIIIDLPQQYRMKFAIGPLRVDRVINPPVLFGRPLVTHLGLDLSGGTHITLAADMKDIAPEDRSSALESVREVIERRVNFFGISEPIVQTSRSRDNYRVIVELPGITNVDQAVAAIGQTARLEFREISDPQALEATTGAVISLANTKPVGITGKDLKRASLSFSNQTGEAEVALEFTSDGAKKFADVTAKLVGKPLAIFLDDFPISAPVVNAQIPDGNAVITGNFTTDTAKILALQLNAGALPVPVTVIEKRTIGATLGQESVAKSIRAGAIGLAIVAIFMVAKYGRLGLLADLALVLYGLISFALVRLIPIALTLPGIAGFILSIGMAVDSNILIFERYKEELRKGKPWQIAMELGFTRAWDSIRDANFTTIITCLILFNPGNWHLLPVSGLVRGFALTLFIGVLTSLFTGIVVTRTLIRVLYKERQ
ncbi:protein translocase subunit SecD [Candidatus Gottesmanbacteria bacterium]|nr:protein translocase subunit SecD [Candidatus Gottesmanbacteria bacterium]